MTKGICLNERQSDGKNFFPQMLLLSFSRFELLANKFSTNSADADGGFGGLDDVPSEHKAPMNAKDVMIVL